MKQNTGMPEFCGPVNRELGWMIFRPRENTNTVCVYSFSNRKSKQYQLLLYNFIFQGPDMISHVSPSACQYGGLVIYFTPEQPVEYCENLHNLFLYSVTDTFLLVVIWFSGYTNKGILVMNTLTEECNAVYGELLALDNNNNSDVVPN